MATMSTARISNDVGRDGSASQMLSLARQRFFQRLNKASKADIQSPAPTSKLNHIQSSLASLKLADFRLRFFQSLGNFHLRHLRLRRASRSSRHRVLYSEVKADFSIALSVEIRDSAR